MKKLSRKLLLSALSLGLAVVTLSTTTYAWYVTNASVSATGVQGTTKGDIDGSLQISKNASNWAASVDLSDKSTHSSDGSEMIPLQLNNTDGILYALDNTTKGGAKSYIEFYVYIKVADETLVKTVYLQELIIEHAVETVLPVKNVLNTDAAIKWPTGVGLGATYTVDALRVLSMEIKVEDKLTSSTDLTLNESGNITRKSTGYTQLAVDAIDEIAAEMIEDTVTSSEDLNAITYYNKVMEAQGKSEDAISKPATYKDSVNLNSTSTGTSAIIGEIGGTDYEYSKVTFRFWLDGWDQYCFDACQNQSFNISFKFTSELSEVGIYF